MHLKATMKYKAFPNVRILKLGKAIELQMDLTPRTKYFNVAFPQITQKDVS